MNTATQTQPDWLEYNEEETLQFRREAQYELFVEKEIAQLAAEIAADNDALPETVRHWDVECFERNCTDTQLGTAQQFAERLYEEGWRLNPHKRIECGKCQESPVEPDWSPGLLEADERADEEMLFQEE